MSHKLDTTILGNIVFIFFLLAYNIQKYLSKIFFFLFIQPALWLSKLFNAERGLPDDQKRMEDNKSFVVLDTFIWHHNALINYFKFAFKVNSFISGVRHRFNIYEHILNWNQQVPLIGFEEDRTTFTIETLHGVSERGGRYINIIWLGTHNVCGKFKILSKEVQSDSDEIEVKAVWPTGEERGKTFNVGRLFPYRDSLKKSYVKPSSIYYPPKWIVFVVELLLSASAVMAFFELTKNGWKWLLPILQNILNAIYSSYEYIAESLSKWG